MTEKRFQWVYIKDNKLELRDNGIVKVFNNERLEELLNDLAEENEQLKQRNNRQYEQLNKLWGLIQAKDWETLTAMDNQMKEDEERLQREWKCYE